MNTAYHNFLEIEVLHAFFEHERCRDIQVIPLAATANKLTNYNILVQQHANLFRFYVGTNSEESFDISDQFIGLKDLNFQVVTGDNYFFNYTDLNPVSEQGVYYFSNLNASNTSSALHSDEAVSEQELIALSPKKFRINIAENVFSFEITNSDGEPVFTADLEAQPDSVVVDLSSFEDGLYNILENGEESQSVFCCDDTFQAGSFGVLSIDMEALLNNTEADKKYHIRFKAREVFLKYKILVHETRNIEVKSMEIKAMAGETYVQTEEMIDSIRLNARVFTSDRAFALNEKADKHPTLVVKYIGEHSINIDEMELKLPQGNHQVIEKFKTGEHEGSFFSPIIIYV